MGYSQDEANNVYASAMVVLLWASIISAVASIITVYLMFRLNVWKNRLMGIIFAMTIMQLIYDISLLLFTFCGTPLSSDTWAMCTSSQMGFGFCSGMAGATCTNIVSFLVAYVVLTRKRLSLTWFWTANIILTPSLVLGALCWYYFYEYNYLALHQGDAAVIAAASNIFAIAFSIYDYIRMTQVAINIICVIVIFYNLWAINIICVRDSRSRQLPSTSNLGVSRAGPKRNDESGYPMFLLAMRLVWYPIAQTITRFGASYYQISTGKTTSSYPQLAMASNSPNILSLKLYLYVVFTPSAGLAYFFIFLLMQTGAWAEFKRPFVWLWNKACCKPVLNTEEQVVQSTNTLPTSSKSKTTSRGSTTAIQDEIPAAKLPIKHKRKDLEFQESNMNAVNYAYEDGSDIQEAYGYDAEEGHDINDDDEFDVDNYAWRVSASEQRDSKVSRVPPHLSSASDMLATARADLERMRLRTSLDHNSPVQSVTNVEAILEAGSQQGAHIPNNVVDLLNEDELFELIAEQQKQADTNDSRARGKAEIGLVGQGQGSSRRASGGAISSSSASIGSPSSHIGGKATTVTNPLRDR